MVKQHGAGDSIRTKSKQELNTKIVYRPVLDNPLTINWPTIGAPIRNLILEALITFLETKTTEDELNISEWRLQEHARKRGRVHGSGTGKGKQKEVNEVGENGKRVRVEDGSTTEGKKSKKSKVSKVMDNTMMDTTSDSTITASTLVPVPLDAFNSHDVKLRSDKSYTIPNFEVRLPPPPKVLPPPFPRPKLLDHFCVGINEVTKSLENRIRWGRRELGDSSALPVSTKSVSKITEEEKEAKKVRKRHHKISKAKASIIVPTSKPLALNFLYPASTRTLQRPSFEFLSQPLPKADTSLPAWLLPPTDPNPFFSSQNAAHLETLVKPTLNIPNSHYRKTFIESVMVQDDPVGDRIRRLKKKKEDDQVQSISKVQEKKSNEQEKGEAVGKSIEKETDETTQENLLPPILLDLIFVCRPDINPPSLVAHLPTMTAVANGISQALKGIESNVDNAEKIEEQMEVETEEEEEDGSQQGNVFLIPFDIGAETRLGAALALRRVATIAVSSTAPQIEPLLALIHKHVTPLQAPWLVPHLTNLPSSTSEPISQVLIPTHIKHLKSTAPRDPKAALAAKKAAKKLEKMKGKGEIYVAED